jgi:hypothetical protein
MPDIRVEVVQNVNEVLLSQEVIVIDLGFGGPQGPRGNSVLSGYGAPSVYLGIPGDHYIDKDTNELYGPKVGSDWGIPVDLVTNEELGYVHDQPNPASTWTISHGLGFTPNISVVDSAGTVVEGSYNYPDSNTVVATFSSQFSGKAYLS